MYIVYPSVALTLTLLGLLLAPELEAARGAALSTRPFLQARLYWLKHKRCVRSPEMWLCHCQKLLLGTYPVFFFASAAL